MTTVEPGRALRDALGCFATGVTIVTAPSTVGSPIGLTVSSFNSVSLDPPLILFSIAVSARSLDELRAAPAFAVNVLSVDQVQLSDRFARPSEQKWDGVEYELGIAGTPLLAGTAARFECEPYALHEGGDHVVFIGRVLHHQASAEAEPLLFHRGAYRAVADMPRPAADPTS